MSTGFILNKARENISVIILIMMPSVARLRKISKNPTTIYMYQLFKNQYYSLQNSWPYDRIYLEHLTQTVGCSEKSKNPLPNTVSSLRLNLIFVEAYLVIV